MVTRERRKEGLGGRKGVEDGEMERGMEGSEGGREQSEGGKDWREGRKERGREDRREGFTTPYFNLKSLETFCYFSKLKPMFSFILLLHRLQLF